MTSSTPPPFQHAQHYIDGGWRESGAVGEVQDPATGEVIGNYSLGSKALAEEAISSARRCFQRGVWSRSPRLRSDILLKFADALEAKRNDLIKLITYENGKTITHATMEVQICISELRFYAGLARTIFGRMSEIEPNQLSLLSKEPIGVAAIIVPWNAPATLLIRSLAPAMAAGCTTVIKPAPQTPLINKVILECLVTIPGVPRGLINSVNENGIEVGVALSESKDVDVISFTGSSSTGKTIMKNSASTLKRLSLELGGKAPSIIFPQADIGRAIAGITRGGSLLSGQMCVAIARILVPEDMFEAVTDKLVRSFSSLKVGPGYNPKSEMGAIIDRQNVDRLKSVINQAESDADILLKGHELSEHPEGCFLTPTLFSTDDPLSPLVQDEHFGPIISVETFQHEAEAIEKANCTNYGLAASLWTQDIDQAMRVSREIESGTVWINCHGKLSAESETGGYKHSGIGRMHGVEGLNDFLETKNVYIDIDAGVENSSVDMLMPGVSFY
jgi:acyl-CoA reductase-like NAD-dependent aldehyde dehydrogenase